MIAKEILTTDIPSLYAQDSVEDALGIMELNKITHLPLLEENELQSLISETDLLDVDGSDVCIGDIKSKTEYEAAKSTEHIYNVLDIANKYQLSLVPIQNEENHYVGSISYVELIQASSTLLAVDGPGGIISLSVRGIDYSLAEISRIVEDNDTKILSLSVVPETVSGDFKVTLKLNREDISSVIKSFERYEYKIKAWYMHDGRLDQVIQDRYNSLMHFLDL